AERDRSAVSGRVHMPRLVDQALDAIGDTDSEVAADGIRLAASFFEHSHGRTEGLDREEGLAEPAGPADLARLRGRLVDRRRAGAAAPVAGAAVFALGKLYDPGLTGFFVEVLQRHLHGDANVLYQAMIALDNLDVDVFAGRRSMSVLAEAENRAMAAEFLRRFDTGGAGPADPGAAPDPAACFVSGGASAPDAPGAGRLL